MTAGVVVVVVAAFAAVAAVVGLVVTSQRREERWRNAELFLPHTSPIGFGGRIVARYRCRVDGSGARVARAELRCEELDRRADRAETVVVAPLELIDYSTDDMVEADIVVAVPLGATAASLEGNLGAICWSVVVTVEGPDGTRSEVARPVTVGPGVAP